MNNKLNYRALIRYLPKAIKSKIYRLLVKLPPTIPENIYFKFATQKEDLEQAFHLLHDAYVNEGLMDPHHSKMRVTPYHALPWAYTLIAIDKNNSKVIGTLTIIKDSAFGLPSDNLIGLQHLRARGRYCAEISALAIERGYRGKIIFPLLKFMYESCVYFLNIEQLIVVLAANSLGPELYEALLFFRKIENTIHANYAFSNYKPVVAETLNLKWAKVKYRSVYGKNPEHRNLFSFFTELKTEHFLFPQKPKNETYLSTLNTELFHYFFCERTQCLQEMTDKQAFMLKDIYKGSLYEEIIYDRIQRSSTKIL